MLSKKKCQAVIKIKFLAKRSKISVPLPKILEKLLKSTAAASRPIGYLLSVIEIEICYRQTLFVRFEYIKPNVKWLKTEKKIFYFYVCDVLLLNKL